MSFSRLFARRERRNDAAPVLLLMSLVLLPTIGLLWFMNAAMRNERLAVQQRLLEVYRSQLLNTRERLDLFWRETAENVEAQARENSAPEVFAHCVRAGLADAVLVFDTDKHILYPNLPAAVGPIPNGQEERWMAANRFEHADKNRLRAAGEYAAIVEGTTNRHLKARALQAQARCLVRAGQTNAALKLVTEVLGTEPYDEATDAQGRAIVPNAELMALELLDDPTLPLFQRTAERLRNRLENYARSPLAAAQRRFLMKEWMRICPGEPAFATLPGEELLARLQERVAPEPGESSINPTVLSGVWQFTTPNGRVSILMRAETLRGRLLNAASKQTLTPDATLALLPPAAGTENVLVSVSAGARMPGWRLGLSFKDEHFFESAAHHQAAIYLWFGLLVVALVLILGGLGTQALRRQTALARLKNDLTATVSHELKTPLSSMRVLVDTLLNAAGPDQGMTREYLQLIALENERLSRLIENFLTFSRLERNKYTFQFVPVSPTIIITEVAAMVRERFKMSGGAFQIQADGHLPLIMADADSLGSALLNLLDNAHKYSEEIKRIVLRAYAQDAEVVFEVEDNGIGIAPSERRKIFDRFYQIDQRLSRGAGGCGLGLSIVQFIVRAHHGEVRVRSQLGGGSIFAITIPTSAAAQKS